MKIIQLVIDTTTSNNIGMLYFRIDDKYMIICANIHIDEMLSDYIIQAMYAGFCRKFSVMHLG